MPFDMRQGRYRKAATFALRLSVAALLGLWVANLTGVRLPLWVVLTAMVVTQTSLGRSLKATIDYFAGTLCGAVWGGIVASLLPQNNELAVLGTLALVLAPLAFAAAMDPRFTAAPITGAIVVLVPQMTHATTMTSVVERVVEVGLGGVIGLVISLLLLPSSAYRLVRDQASVALDQMAKASAELIGGLENGLDSTAARRIQEGIGPSLSALASLIAEAEHERRVRLGSEDTGPLLRSLMRLRHDLVILGRAAGKPLPTALMPRLAEALVDSGRTLEHYMVESANALRQQMPAPKLHAVDNAVQLCAAEVEAARRANALRQLSSDSIEHLFAVGFALDQTRRDLADLKRCIDEWAA